MLEYIKQWLAQRRGGSVGDLDADNLPTPKTAGDQPLSRSRLIVLDLEIAGLNAAKNDVIAICGVAIKGSIIHLNVRFDLIIRWRELDIQETAQIHGNATETITKSHGIEEALLYLL